MPWKLFRNRFQCLTGILRGSDGTLGTFGFQVVHQVVNLFLSGDVRPCSSTWRNGCYGAIHLNALSVQCSMTQSPCWVLSMATFNCLLDKSSSLWSSAVCRPIS